MSYSMFNTDVWLEVAEGEGDDRDHEAVPVYGTNMDDNIQTGGGPQEIFAGNGNDTVRAGGGPDIIWGGNGNDLLIGQGGPDRIVGGNGQDVLQGGPGPDVLDGGNGKDVLIGGVAADTLTGGQGADVFVYLSSSDAPSHGSDVAGHEEDVGFETITDFDPTIDRLDFSAIGTVTGYTEGPTANSVWAEQVGADTALHVDTDGVTTGETPGEMYILLLGVDAASLTAADFIL